MKSNKKFILFSIIGMLSIVIMYTVNSSNNNFLMNSKTLILSGIRSVKITEEKIKIEDKNVKIKLNMPEIHYNNKYVERYINTYIRKNINDFVNSSKTNNIIFIKIVKKYIDINYHIVFEDKNLLNIIIYKEYKYR